MAVRKVTRSAKLFARAQQVMPGGVSSPVRAFKAVGGTPRFMKSGKGAYIKDEDGRTYLDYVMSWGPLIHGHAPKGLLVGAGASRQARHQLRCADAPRDRDGRGRARAGAVDGAGALHEFGHRGRDERRCASPAPRPAATP